eukprot:610425-Ditylum_brightwellii.AAC.1
MQETRRVDNVIPAPTLSPTLHSSLPTSSTSQPCSDGDALIGIFLSIDDFKEETSLTFSELGGAVFIEQDYGQTLAFGIGDLDWEGCLPADVCYLFTIKDKWGDGMCCAHGEGSYS